jgi:antitoxin VapB
MNTAKLFNNGASQAVRLPKAFRFDNATEVSIVKRGEAVILRPLKRPGIDDLIASLEMFDAFPERAQPTQTDARANW